MTNKVIQALECISGKEVYCEDCSYSALYRYNFYMKRCAKDAIDLINHLKTKCNKYLNKVQAQKGELARLYKQNAEYKAEIDAMRKFIHEHNLERELLSYQKRAEKIEHNSLCETETYKVGQDG